MEKLREFCAHKFTQDKFKYLALFYLGLYALSVQGAPEFYVDSWENVTVAVVCGHVCQRVSSTLKGDGPQPVRSTTIK